MKFALSEEQRQFSTSLRALLDDANTPSIVRSWSAGEHHPGMKLWRELAELGVTALLISQRWGGVEAEPADWVVAVEELGYSAVPGPIVESAAVVPILLTDDDREASHWLPGLSSGDVLATVSVPPHVPYLLDADAAELRLRLEGSKVVKSGAADPLSSVDRSRHLFVPAVDGAEVFVAQDGTAARAFEFGVLATAAQLLGAGRFLLDSAVEYAKQRSQYGREIGQFQAIKHMLADVATQCELARPLLYAAAVSLAEDSQHIARDVSAAKVAAGEGAYLAARAALQIHGAVGYTAEHDLSLWLTKVRALLTAWGTSSHHRARVAAALDVATSCRGSGSQAALLARGT